MRITIVQGAFLPVPAKRGGAIEKAWHALGAEFARRGHEVTHVSRRCDGLPAREVLDGVRHVRIQGFDTPAKLWWLKTLDLLYTLRAVAALPPADILVTHTFFLPVLARLRPGAGRPYVHVGRYPRGQMKLYRRAGGLQAPSAPIAEAIRAELGGGEGPLVSSIGYPVPPLPASAAGATRASKRLLYVGRVHPEKGLDLLIDGFSRFASSPAGRGWTLRIVGPWETATGGGGEAYRRALEERARGAGAAVEFTGPVFDTQRLALEYAQGTLFAYPSLAERGETFGLAVLEAMSAGLPAVVSSLGCFTEFLEPGVNGLAFDHRAAEPAAGLATALDRLALGLGDGEADQREAARRTARRFSLEAIASAHLRDFEQILARRP